MSRVQDTSFIGSYLSSFDTIDGIFSPDAALMFMAYEVELDVVWEGVTWLKSKGSPTSIVGLTVA